MMKPLRVRLYTIAGLTVAGLISACAVEDLASPSRVERVQSTSNAEGGNFPAEVTLCKVGPEGTTATFDISRSAEVGALVNGTPITLESVSLENIDVTKCRTVWLSSGTNDPAVGVTITERDQPNLFLYRIVAYYGQPSDTWITLDNPVTPSFTADVSGGQGAMVWFKNQLADEPPPPPEGGEGCTPGFWKTKPHQSMWAATGYSQNQLFSSVFVDAYPGKTLLQVVSLTGNSINSLGRHAVAALLNAAHPDVQYDLTVSGVISTFNSGFTSGNYSTAKNVLESFNEQSCPL